MLAALQTSEVVYIPVEKISPNPYQPRRVFEKSSIEELSKSIKQYGVIQPISVRAIGSKFELVAGERRLRASRLAGLYEIPAIIINITDNDSAILALIENLQRENLNFIEEAEGFLNLMTDYKFTQEMIAEKVSKSQSSVANKLRILRLPKQIQQKLLEHGLTERHARALLSLDTEEKQTEAVNKIIACGLTVKQTEELIKMMMEGKKGTEKKPPKMRKFIRDMRLFTNTIKQAVEILNTSGLPTEYEVEESADGCMVTIAVSYNNSKSD